MSRNTGSMPVDGYELIRVAIIRQAIRDYRAVLRTKNFHAQKSLERFFLGEWGQLLSDGHGEYIIERCKKEVGKY